MVEKLVLFFSVIANSLFSVIDSFDRLKSEFKALVDL